MRIRSVMRPRYGKGVGVAIERAIGGRLSPADTGVSGQTEASVLSRSSQQRLTEDCDMARVLFVVFGGLAYLIFFATFLYLIAFVGDLPGVPRTVDRGPAGDRITAFIVDLGLIGLFGLQHTIMARQGFKRGWTGSVLIRDSHESGRVDWELARVLFVVFGVLAYLIFFATFLYLIAFVGDLPGVPRTVDRGPAGDRITAFIVDLGLIGLFGLQHTIMARQGFKRGWTAIVPKPVERSVYVLFASIALLILFAFWRPIPQPVWTVEHPLAVSVLWALFAIGWLIVLSCTCLINHFEQD